MILTKHICISFLLLFCYNIVLAQTEIGGVINSDSTLTLAASPYMVTSDLVIAPDGKITIEAGATLLFSNNIELEVRGILHSLGTENNKITFTSAEGVSRGSWVGIDIKNTLAQEVIIEHSNISNAATGVHEECCFAIDVTISNCDFIHNSIAIGGYSGNASLIKNCYFSDNTNCITSADKEIRDCVFEDNVYGLFNTERISVYNSSFTGHSEVALKGGRGNLENTIIENNNIGIQTFFEGFNIEGCTISNNQIGIDLENAGSNYAPIANSEICNNAEFNVKNKSNKNVSLFSNCWCDSDQENIEAKLYDGDDENGIGFISYTIYDESCTEVLETVDKTLPKSNVWTLQNSPYILNENFIVLSADTLYIEAGVEVRMASQTNLEVRGSLLAIGTEDAPILFTSNTSAQSGSWEGIRIMHSENANAQFDYCVIEYASLAIFEECCWGGMVSIENSKFLNNETAIGGYSGDNTIVKGCYFSGNTNCLTNADKLVEDCVFENNDYGLFYTERISVFNSSFTGHREAALYGGRGLVQNTTLINNNIGVQTFFQGFEIDSCTISENTIGIQFDNYDSDFASITNSQICNNIEFNAVNNSEINIFLFSNCWCDSDQLSIEENIFDGDDDNDFGLISYDVYEDDCEELIVKVDKSSPDIFYWTLPNSPYVITEDYVLFPNKTLIIEPGVQVKVAPGAKFEIRGALLAQGTAMDSISFSSTSGQSKGSWFGIDVLNTLGGNAVFDYCTFKYAEVAVQEECCWGGLVSVANCSFIENGIGLGGYSGDVTPVDSCYFAHNTYGMTQADKSINNSVFEDNEYGLYQTERIDVRNSQFYNHTMSGLYGGRGIVDQCEIINNNIGIKSFFEGFEVFNSVINQNLIGIELSEYGDTVSIVQDNNICFNENFNVYNTSDNNVSLITNCWCDSDSTRVEDLLFDGWDDSSVGLMDYTLFTDDCVDQIFQTDKVNGNITYFTTSTSAEHLASANENLSVHPNPASEFLVVEYDAPIEEIEILDYTGRVVSVHQANGMSHFRIDLNQDLSGIYLLRVRLKHQQILSKKIVISK